MSPRAPSENKICPIAREDSSTTQTIVCITIHYMNFSLAPLFTLRSIRLSIVSESQGNSLVDGRSITNLVPHTRRLPKKTLGRNKSAQLAYTLGHTHLAATRVGKTNNGFINDDPDVFLPGTVDHSLKNVSTGKGDKGGYDESTVSRSSLEGYRSTGSGIESTQRTRV